MNLKRLALASLFGSFACFLFGGLWHVAIFKTYYYGPALATFYRSVDGSKHGQIMLADLIRGTAIAVLYAMMTGRGASPVSQGLKFGAAIGALFVAVWVLMVDAVAQVPDAGYVPLEATFSMLQGLLAGVAVAKGYGKPKA